jgi:hypothetical protein
MRRQIGNFGSVPAAAAPGGSDATSGVVVVTVVREIDLSLP